MQESTRYLVTDTCPPHSTYTETAAGAPHACACKHYQCRQPAAPVLITGQPEEVVRDAPCPRTPPPVCGRPGPQGSQNPADHPGPVRTARSHHAPAPHHRSAGTAAHRMDITRSHWLAGSKTPGVAGQVLPPLAKQHRPVVPNTSYAEAVAAMRQCQQKAKHAVGNLCTNIYM